MLATASTVHTVSGTVSDRRLAITARTLGQQLEKERPKLVRAHARGTGTSAAIAASQLVRYALLHRAAELLVGHSIKKKGVLARVPAPPDDAIAQALANVSPSDGGAAWGGQIYTRLFRPHERRPQGQFFTPSMLATFMADWAITSASDAVLDPGSGPGLLLAAAAERLRSLGALRPERQIQGLELCPLASTFAAIALLPRSGVPAVAQSDFLLWKAPRAFDAIVCNPPYTRHQGLGSEYKEQIGEVVDKLIGEHLSRRSGIYVHFLMRSISMLKEGGRLAFITPREMLDAGYGRAPKRYLLERCRLRALVIFDAGRTFPGVDTTSAITLVERGQPDGEAVRVLHVRRLPTAGELTKAVEGRAAGSLSWGTVEIIKPDDLARHTRWSRVHSTPTKSPPTTNTVALSDLVDVKRGIATGANNFFMLSAKQLKAAKLPRSSVRAALGHSRLARGTRVSEADVKRWAEQGERVWLLDVRGETKDAHVRAYLKTGEDSGVSKGFLCRSRDRWYEMEKRVVPPILMTYMSKGAPRFLRNDAGVMPLNVFHGIYPKGLSKSEVTRLLTHLRSKAFASKLRLGARTYADGLLKVEPRELGAVTVPDIRRRHPHTPSSRGNTQENT